MWSKDLLCRNAPLCNPVCQPHAVLPGVRMRTPLSGGDQFRNEPIPFSDRVSGRSSLRSCHIDVCRLASTVSKGGQRRVPILPCRLAHSS
eukprot:9837648-Lingulodinium_polyedra.AAC.1